MTPQSAPQPPPPVFLPPVASSAAQEPTSPSAEPPAQAPPVAVYLRGAEASKSTWTVMTDLTAEQGWVATRDRNRAWHLARGGLPTVMIEFSGVNLDTPGVVRVAVARVEAKYAVSQRQVNVGRLLQAADRRRLDGASWLDELVSSEVREMDLPDRDRVIVRLRLADSDAIATAHLVQAVQEAAV